MMGHTTTHMLVEHYYKFIPRRIRQDGERFTKALQDAFTRQPSLASFGNILTRITL